MPEPGGLPARGTVLAFDFGEKRIGVAVGECELRSASPLLTFDAVVDAIGQIEARQKASAHG